jgi:hypothetical protein
MGFPLDEPHQHREVIGVALHSLADDLGIVLADVAEFQRVEPGMEPCRS